MSKKQVLVDADALTQVLRALNGPGHHIRELQATRGLSALGVSNPIEQLQSDLDASLAAPAVGAPVQLDLSAVPRVYPTQDPKYAILSNRLVNAASLEPIPEDEGICIFRFRDIDFVPTVEHYMSRVRNGQQRYAMSLVHTRAVRFAQQNPHRMKDADTVLSPAVLSQG